MRLELACVQCNISDSQTLFWCSAIILEMASLDTYVLRESKPDFVFSLLLIFYQNQGFCVEDSKK